VVDLFRATRRTGSSLQVRTFCLSFSLSSPSSLEQVHAPLQLPAALLANFTSFINNTNRAHYAALANSLDTHVGRVVDALIARGLWNNTLFVLSSDNGGPVYLSNNTDSALDGSGNNWPLRGGKVSNWEGGVRVNAFVSGGFVPEARRGTVEQGLTAIEDWCVSEMACHGTRRDFCRSVSPAHVFSTLCRYATFCALAGVDPTDTRAAAAGLPPIDSLNLWPLLSGANPTSPRTEVILGWSGTGVLEASYVQVSCFALVLPQVERRCILV
jgi:arylsulfatase B